jgi:SAM-dependent methyltransferase
MDLTLLFAVVHEVDDPARFFSEVHEVLRSGGRLLFAEPKGHIRENVFRESVSRAERSGFRQMQSLRIPWSRAVLLEKRK